MSNIKKRFWFSIRLIGCPRHRCLTIVWGDRDLFLPKCGTFLVAGSTPPHARPSRSPVHDSWTMAPYVDTTNKISEDEGGIANSLTVAMVTGCPNA